MNQLNERLTEIESRLERLEGLVVTPIALTSSHNEQLSFDAAEQLVRQHLPVVEEKEDQIEGASEAVTEAPVSASPPGGDTDATVALALDVTRAVASRFAATTLPQLLSRNFRPSEFGYTTEDFARDYPDVNPGDVLESFFNHHLAKQTKSKNWLELFWGYAKIANDMEREKKMSNPTPTDSMGLPTDRRARRRMLGQD